MPFFPTDILNKSITPQDLDEQVQDEVNFSPLSLDLNRYLVGNTASTFFAKVEGSEGDILVIDKSVEPKHGMTVVVYADGIYRLMRFEVIDGVCLLANDEVTLELTDDPMIWGVVRYYIKKM